jgi:hypothetical protein
MLKSSKAKFVFALAAIVTLAGTVAFTVHADSDTIVKLTAKLTGYQEAPGRFTTGTGTFNATVDLVHQTMTFTETWKDLSGVAVTTPAHGPLFSHIHFGQPNVSGGIMLWLCGVKTTTNDPDSDLQVCPAGTSGTVTDTVEAADVIPTGTAGADQGVNAGDFAGFLKIIRAGNAYANVHTDRFPGGEIRGQIHVVRPKDDDDDDTN